MAPLKKGRKQGSSPGKKEKRCKDPECCFCLAEPCGVCGPCLNPRLKTKCKKRYTCQFVAFALIPKLKTKYKKR